VIGAFACIYLVWGSTYLAIRFAVETIPPFLMAAARFLAAGGILYAWARLAGSPPVRRNEWPGAALIGGLLLLGGNGLLSWSERRVPSGLASLIIATIPLWMAGLDWLWLGGARPTRGLAAGLLLGFSGTALLVDPADVAGASGVGIADVAVLLLASASWASGSLLSRTARLPAAPLMATAAQLLAGGALLAAAGLALGEGAALDLAAVSARSILSLVYLVLFGSVLAFTAYIWLLRVSTPARVSTYAYANPVVALALGWALGGEPIGARTLLAAAVILTAVAVITTRRERRPSGAGAAAERSTGAGTAAAPGGRLTTNESL
jgi:drug/metabolite transporter (DMT)-like permease